MVGGHFDEHPWGIIEPPVLVEDHAFPGMSALPDSFRHIDEYYQIKDFSRSNAHVLLRLDASYLDMNMPLVHHKDADFPLAWAKTYGKGRVCTTPRLGTIRVTGMNEPCRRCTLRRCCDACHCGRLRRQGVLSALFR